MKKLVTLSAVLFGVLAIALIVFLNRKTPSVSDSQINSEQVGENADLKLAPPEPQFARKPTEQQLADLKNIDPVKKEKIDSYMVHSGFTKTLEFMEGSLQDLFADLLKDESIPPEERDALLKYMDSMNAESISAEYRKILSEKFSEQELARLDEVYKDPVVQEFSDEMQQATLPGESEKYAKFMEKFDINKLPADKKNAINEFAENQMKMFPMDDPIFESSPEMKSSILAETRREMANQLAYSLKNKSPVQIRELLSKMSDDVVRKAGLEQARLMFKIARDSMESAGLQK